MLDLIKSLLFTRKPLLKTKQELALENLALRQQLAVFARSVGRYRLEANRAVGEGYRCVRIIIALDFCSAFVGHPLGT